MKNRILRMMGSVVGTGVLAFSIMMAGLAQAWTVADVNTPEPNKIKVGLQLYVKGTQTPLPYSTIRINFNPKEGASAYWYATSDATGFAYVEIDMTNTGVIYGQSADGKDTVAFDLRKIAGEASGGRVDTDPINYGSEWTWGTVSAGVDTRYVLGGYHAAKLRQNAGGGYSHDNAGLNTLDTDGNGRYDWMDEGCSIHFSCYMQSAIAQHWVNYDRTGISNTGAFVDGNVAHGATLTTAVPICSDPDYTFDHWQVWAPSHIEETARVAAPAGAVAIQVNQAITLKPVWKYDPGTGPSTDDPAYQFCHELEKNFLKVAMKFYDYTTGVTLKNVTIGLCFTIPDPTNDKKELRRNNVIAATTDSNGELKMRVQYDDDGYIYVNGVKSTEINLNTVTKIDCGPVADVGWNWNTSVAGRIRNMPTGYSVNMTRIVQGGGIYHDAVVPKEDVNGNGIYDYVDQGASLYFECYLEKQSAGGNSRTILFDTSTIRNASAFPNTTCTHGAVYAPPATTPVNNLSPDRAFLGWTCQPLTTANVVANYPGATFEYSAPFTANENMQFIPIWGPNPNAVGRIRFQVRLWDHGRYWDNQAHWQSNPDVLGPQYGQTALPIDGLTFVIKSYDSALYGTLPDSVKVPVGRPNTAEGWVQSRIEARYTGKDANGFDTWDATYEISNEQLQYLHSNWIIDTDPDEHDLATYDRDLGWGPETVTFDWDWFIKKDDREGAGLTGVRVIPQCQRRGGVYPNGSNKNDVIQLSDDMIANGFDFTFQCWVVPALVVDFDTDGGSPMSYSNQRWQPIDSCPLWEQRFVATNPGSPARGEDERFEGWYEVLSTDVDGTDHLASSPWNFSKTVEHSMTLKAVYRKSRYSVSSEPVEIKVTGPGTLTFQQVLSNPGQDPNTRLSITVDGGETVYTTSSTTDELRTLVFGGEVDIEHVVRVSFTTTYTDEVPAASLNLGNVQWQAYDPQIMDAVVDRESTIFTVENLGTTPANETSGVTFFDGVAKITTSTVNAETGKQTESTVNPAGGATASTTGTEDYWYMNYEGKVNNLATNNATAMAETPPTLSAREATTFRVSGITGASVIRWEAFVTDGEAGDATPSDLTVTVTLTPTNGPVRTVVKTYHASDFQNGNFSAELLDFKNELKSTTIALDFTYTNNDQGDGRAFVDNIYWKCVQEDGGHTWMKENPGEGVALMIVDHEDAGDGYVYLAFTPQLREGVDAMFWFTNSVKRGYFDVKTGTSRTAAESAAPSQIAVSTAHESTPAKVWVKVPQSAVESGEFSKLFVAGKPVNYKNKDGTIAQTSATGSGAESVNTFGTMKVLATTTNTMVSVPWTWYSDQESGAGNIPADKLVKTTNLTVGDLLYAYSGSGQYLGWTVAEVNGVLQWQPIATVAKVGGNATVIVHDESGNNRTTLPRGAGVWVVRQHPVDDSGNAVPFWLYGQSVTTAATTTIAPKGEGESARSTMLGNPYPVAVHINQLTFNGTINDSDTIVVPNGTDSPRYLQYRDTGTKRNPTGTKKWVWVHLDTSTTPAKNVYDWDVTIPAGLAFWYERRGTTALSVTWVAPVE